MTISNRSPQQFADICEQGKKIHAHLLGDFFVIRLLSVLTAAEQQLVESVAAENANDEIQEAGDTDVHRHFHEGERP